MKMTVQMKADPSHFRPPAVSARTTLPGLASRQSRYLFPNLLRRADVAVATMMDGQHQSLILGNGDLYGIVWEKGKGI